MREKGRSYKEILKEVPVSKSSLSQCLKDSPLTEDEKRYLKSRRDSNISRGRIKAVARHRQRRIKREQVIFSQAKKEFGVVVLSPLFHTGIALYWAEGAKRSNTFQFSNSDPEMTEIMILWIEQYLNITRKDIYARLYMHKPYAYENWEQFWAQKLAIPQENFKKTVFKPTGLLVKKRPITRVACVWSSRGAVHT